MMVEAVVKLSKADAQKLMHGILSSDEKSEPPVVRFLGNRREILTFECGVPEALPEEITWQPPGENKGSIGAQALITQGKKRAV
jgi:hypothetical protein